MIFKRLFSSSYKSQDPRKRIEAISKLEPSTPQDKQALHELAFNDEDKLVSLAALQRLASFALWQKMAQTARDPYVKREAQRIVDEAILEQNSFSLADKERTAYLLESANNELRMQYLEAKPQHQSEQDTLRLLERINNASFTLKFISKLAAPDVQKKWILSATDKKILQKVKNKTDNAEIAELIGQRLSTLDQVEQKPLQLSQQTTFVLSKLQALTERSNFEEITSQHRLLNEEYKTLSEDFGLLSADKKLEIEEKFVRISDRIEKVIARLAPLWEQQQLEAELEQRRNSLNRLRDSLVGQVDKLLTAQPSELASMLSEVETKRDALYQQVQQVEAIDGDFPQAEFIGVADKVSDTLANLDALRAACQNAKEIINESELLSASETLSKEEQLIQQHGLAERWSQLIDYLPVIPASIKSQWQTLCRRWQKQAKQNESRQASIAKSCRQQMSVIESLIQGGKFNAAIGKFTQLESNLKGLSEDKRAALAFRFEKIRENIERLEGWKDYLAAPRRPELINQAKALVSEPVEKMRERAEKVKYLRKQWQSLGPLPDTDAQAVLFDELIERAFAPCRAFYEKQDALREQAKEQRQSLVEQVSNLNPDDDAASLASQVEQLRTRWQKAGKLDHASWRKVKQDWDQALKPILAKIDDWHQDNQRRKQQLIDQVSVSLNDDDVEAAAAFAKQAQQQWKSLGPAGKKADSSLWRSFRTVNDKIFSRLKAQNEQVRKGYQQEKERVLARVQQVNDAVFEHKETNYKQAIQDLENEIDASEVSNDKTIKKALADVIRATQHAEQCRQHLTRQQQLEALLTAIPVFQSSDDPTQSIPEVVWEKLSKQHQSWFTPQASSNEHDRAYLTTKLEWIVGLESPDDSQTERKQLNLELLAKKLEQNYVADFETILGQWVACGPLTDEENYLFERLSRCIHKQIAELEMTSS
ncbi:DUF349 domain-containing protein [Alteromonas ponticola]|uniref:DUF349 domain-containing protein n=1 Tax=Alteromonas ponticola TaxID=2720613 RepID=A0ABX1QWH8_9ALTE|nr:DUF349 domain-containing protein [Alteromonas ponticola]NMH58605.1 DUF349 domain-containing protein [Alteromonas ponticola]